MDVNPYHQAWTETAEDCLTLVSGPGIAEFRVENKAIDAYDFQQAHKVIPKGFFRNSFNGANNHFKCLVCDLTLYNQDSVKSHCASRDHLKSGMEYSRSKMPADSHDMTGGNGPQTLATILSIIEEPCIGLNEIEEWWESSGSENPLYTCKLCQIWGPGTIMSNHIISEIHRQNQLVAKFPILDKMIKGMDRIELLERAQEEEDKLGGWQDRNYKVIKSSTDDAKYFSFKHMLKGGGNNPTGNPIIVQSNNEWPSRRSSHSPSDSSWKRQSSGSFGERSFSSRAADSCEGRSNRRDEYDCEENWPSQSEEEFSRPNRGGWGASGENHARVKFPDYAGRGSFGERGGRGFPDSRGGARGFGGRFAGGRGTQWIGGGGRGGTSRGRFVRRRPWRGGMPPDRLMAAGPLFRGSRGGRLGHAMLPFGRGGGGSARHDVETLDVTGSGPLYGRKVNGEYESFGGHGRVPTLNDPGMFDQSAEFMQPQSQYTDEFENEDELPDAYYAVSGDQEDYGFGDSKVKEKKQDEQKTPIKTQSHLDPDHRLYLENEKTDYFHQRMQQHYKHHRYYGPGVEDQIVQEIRGGRGEFGRDYLICGKSRPGRYFGPEDEVREKARPKDIYEDDGTPYEGPTIFDKVFRKNSRKTSTDDRIKSRSRSRSRSHSRSHYRSRSPSPKRTRKFESHSRHVGADLNSSKEDDEGSTSGKKEIEQQWLMYKEKTEAKIRREKEKLMKYEKKIQELTQRSESEKARLVPLDIDKYERRRNRRKEKEKDAEWSYSKIRSDESVLVDDSYRQGSSSSASARPSSYRHSSAATGGSSKLRRTPSPSSRRTPPPGSQLRPILTPEGDGEYISEDEIEYDNRYSEFASRLSPEVSKSRISQSPENDSYEKKFDPY